MSVQQAWVLKGAIVLSLFAFPSYSRAEFGDMDGDGDIDLHDYALFRACMLGPGQSVSTGCQLARLDSDVDVDLEEMAVFQIALRPNDLCSQPIQVGDGGITFNNEGAHTDGPDEPQRCRFEFGDSQVHSDLWYCYTASCTGTAFASLCGSEYDTKLAVYNGCACPSHQALACSDDDCGTAASALQSRVEFAVTAGQGYMIRVGSFAAFTDGGPGRLTIGCNLDPCSTSTGTCFSASPTHAPGCSDDACCASTCTLDQFCCDVQWDDACACLAQGVCAGGFTACGPGSGSCRDPDQTPGCDDVDCCNTVCSSDPYCCCVEWDVTCVDTAQGSCPTCSPSAGDCFMPHDASPGCNDVTCCEAVCTVDPFCCSTGWDTVCVDEANSVCN